MEQRRELINWLSSDDFDFNYFITANFNKQMSLNAAQSNLIEWHRKLDKYLLGRNFYKPTKNELRTICVACAEHVDSNIHWHFLVQRGDDCGSARLALNHSMFGIRAALLWGETIAGGKMDVQNIDSRGGGKRRLANYMTKEFGHKEYAENILILPTRLNNIDNI